MTHFARPSTIRNSRTIAYLTALGLLLGAGLALATPATGQAKSNDTADHHQGHGRGARLFERWDKDHDGRITIAELPARMKGHVAAIDQNKDGILTKDEFDQGKAQLKALREKELDTNKDGKVTPEERKAAMRSHLIERFAEQDTNHDGALVGSEAKMPDWEHIKVADTNNDSRVTLDELKTALDQGKLQPHRGEHGRMSEGDMKAHAQQRFSADDKNKDGYLTEAEVPKQKWERIKVSDTNRDNKVSFDELMAAFKAGTLGHPGGHRGHGQGSGNRPGPRQ